ncbi:MAG: hypothetical protein EAZ78_17770 [Oscillatoriales cyanobacterium]|uniref:Secreted protein n=1 Tax=Microcoleus anatoxicus PTRS2 TaxID=2705321 RepID=A0ABU8YIP9_9CYAN|nr:MAG: hypothetical protein EA000_17745 [Oscillatoriales cyanobacterium]TAD95300.1 MAG: hypothetical protein EAZ98_16205 [Oscillatoriales cyanobacterium]TAE00981.1 MAG: hypothetical protein EAZ96_20140 [Oscillatoriales cyanobacterium]TAF01607.1 MAG: hypothetical protein EAZ78_17770 [Oscillatoriales cyanobacterium]TAF41242.1 MAG: hypothetical protein EAZ68_10610 [Oscillatoriales cyanobacterium]
MTFGDEWHNLRKNGWAIEFFLQSLFLLSLFECRFGPRSAHSYKGQSVRLCQQTGLLKRGLLTRARGCLAVTGWFDRSP